MKVLMIVQEPVVTRRILQEAKSLVGAGYDVHILTRAEDDHDVKGDIEGIPTEWVAVRGQDPRFTWLYRLLGKARGSNAVALYGVLTGRHTFILRALPRAIASRADVYHAHDLNNLEIAFRAASTFDAKLVYDAHELFSEIANRWIRLKRNAWARLERRLLPHADLRITVNEFIAEEIARRYNVDPPLVVLNCPDPPQDFDAARSYNLIRERLAIPAERKIVLYQGWMWEGRGLEDLVTSSSQLVGDAAVVFMGYGEYQAVLERLAGVSLGSRVYFLPPVSHRDLLPYCASADVGLIPYQPVDLNNYYSSPNKLFDYIQAALPIVASDLPFLRKVIVTDGLGVVAKLDSPVRYAEAINSILSRPIIAGEMRENMRRVAPQYTWAAQARKLIKGYHSLESGR